jgi:hypothetical protein
MAAGASGGSSTDLASANAAAALSKPLLAGLNPNNSPNREEST